jgi:hypothetical protein
VYCTNNWVCRPPCLNRNKKDKKKERFPYCVYCNSYARCPGLAVLVVVHEGVIIRRALKVQLVQHTINTMNTNTNLNLTFGFSTKEKPQYKEKEGLKSVRTKPCDYNKSTHTQMEFPKNNKSCFLRNTGFLQSCLQCLHTQIRLFPSLLAFNKALIPPVTHLLLT